MAEQKVYDVIIIGAGPAGLSAGIYAGRAKLKTLIIEKFAVGGTVNLTYEVKNYPGFENTTGADLMEHMHNQALENDVEIVLDEVINYELDSKVKKIICTSGTFLGRTVILCNGAIARKLGLQNEEKLTGSGVSYCAICDGAFFKNKNVAVVGGGNTATEDAIYLSSIAEKVFLICRKNSFVADKTLVDSVKSKKNIQILKNCEVEEIYGESVVEGVLIKNNLTKETEKLQIDGLFIAIGRDPDTQAFKDILHLSKNGYILTNESMETNIEGVFACGDVREKPLRQIITACSDGAIAGTKANQYLSDKKE